MIHLKNVGVSFTSKIGTVEAVKNVTLNIKSGDIFGIVGFSGAGKSTLIRTINLLQPLSYGQILINGEDISRDSVTDIRNRRKKIGMIFQNFNLLASKTVSQNIAFPLMRSSLSQVDKQKRVLELLDLVGLSDKADTYPEQLSGGQKQRVGIARSIANHPDILLCDEATSALDPQTTEEVLNLLKKLNKSLGLTIITITHEMQVVKSICNRMAVMQAGEIIEQGSVVDIFSSPQKPLTKAFINTATHTDAALKKIIQHRDILQLHKDATLLRITYRGHNTAEPIIAKLSKDFLVTANILSGNIEIIDNLPLGSLIISLTGQPQNVSSALTFLESRGVGIECINRLGGTLC